MPVKTFHFQIIIYILVIFAPLLGCMNNKANHAENNSLNIKSYDLTNKSGFQIFKNNIKTDLFIIKNSKGCMATFTNYGARMVSLQVPDKTGQFLNIIGGYKSIDEYKKSSNPYYGAVIGRYANRIANGLFEIDGKSYSLVQNDGANSLNGGSKGFQNKIWIAAQPDSSTILFSRTSPDLEAGFPGTLEVSVKYHLDNQNRLVIRYEATTNQPTIINLSNYLYFNLNGEGSGTILNHLVKINAENYTPVDNNQIPTGRILPVANTPLDFSALRTMGERINEPDLQLKYARGYNFNYVLDSAKFPGQHLAATVIGDLSSIEMNIYTDQPGIQLYSGNNMNGINTFNNGIRDGYRTAFLLATQHFPDAPNHDNFPSTALLPGQKFISSTLFAFSIKN